MTSGFDDPIQADPDELESGLHEVYAHHVTELGETRQVKANADIFSTSGHKLVARNAPINRHTLEHLTQHKLLRPLDHDLTVERTLTTHDLVVAGRTFVDTDPLLQALISTLKNPQAPLEHLAKVVLAAPVAAKLTVLKERLPGHFDHAVRVALCACGLAEAGGPEIARFAQDLAIAGICHDLGELHIDPAIFHITRPLTPDEERQLHVHPTVAYLLLKTIPQYHPVVSRAVLEHHERLDGSGYPFGRRGDALDVPGRILALAELAVPVYDRSGGDSLAVILRGQPEKLDPLAVNCLLLALNHAPARENDVPRENTDPERIVADLGHMLALVEQGLQVGNRTASPETVLLAARLADLVRSLDRAGIRAMEPGQWLDTLTDTPEMGIELAALTRESRYQLRNIAAEITRQRTRSEETAPPPEALAQWLESIMGDDRAAT